MRGFQAICNPRDNYMHFKRHSVRHGVSPHFLWVKKFAVYLGHIFFATLGISANQCQDTGAYFAKKKKKKKKKELACNTEDIFSQ